MASLIDAENAHAGATRRDFAHLAGQEASREAVNADLKSADRAAMLSSVGQGAGVGAYMAAGTAMGGPAGGVIGALVGGLVHKLF